MVLVVLSIGAVHVVLGKYGAISLKVNLSHKTIYWNKPTCTVICGNRNEWVKHTVLSIWTVNEFKNYATAYIPRLRVEFLSLNTKNIDL